MSDYTRELLSDEMGSVNTWSDFAVVFRNQMRDAIPDPVKRNDVCQVVAKMAERLDELQRRDANDEEQVGVVAVDSGLVWLGDPCYLQNDSLNPWKSRNDFEHKCLSAQTVQFDFPTGGTGLGVSTKNWFGDGVFPVFVQRNDFGRVLQISVSFE